MQRIVRKSGNSLVIGTTPTAKEVLNLKEGDIVEVVVKNKKIIITKVEEDKK